MLWVVLRHHLLVCGRAMAVHPDLVPAQPGIILHQVRPVKRMPPLQNDDTPFGARILRHLAYVAGDEVLQLPRAEAYSEDQGEEHASCNEGFARVVLE